MKRRQAVHQLLPSFVERDAIGNMVRALQSLFFGWGFRSGVFAAKADLASRAESRPAAQLVKQVQDGDVVLIHHSIRSGFLPLLEKLPASVKQVVLYHNITPGFFFEPYERAVARECDAGREELSALARHVGSAFAFSEYSARELRDAGFRETGVLPFPIDWSAFDVRPDAGLADRLDDGRMNILCVGRGEPNKRVDEVLRVFTAFQRMFVPNSRLILAGNFDPGRPYGRHVRAVLQQLVPEEVLLLGRVSGAELSACFEAAHVYLSMSAHEGFGVPLVEAMHRRVPVVAYAAAAVPETLGGAGICVREDDPVTVARAVAAVGLDEQLRASVLASQERRLEVLSNGTTTSALRRAYLEAIGVTVDETHHA